MRPMIQEMHCDPAFDPLLILTDMHLLPEFGSTHEEVSQEDFNICRVLMPYTDNRAHDLADFLADLSVKPVFTTKPGLPDLLILFGDRSEVLTAALWATVNAIPIAHIEGGDITGCSDNAMRNAISKLAHIHFVSRADAGDRLVRMGEPSSSISVVGDLHLDPIRYGYIEPWETVHRALNMPRSEKPFIVLFHPDTLSPGEAGRQTLNILSACHQFSNTKVVIYPCSDPGHRQVIEVVENYNKIHEELIVYKNLESPRFLGLLKQAACIIGNSSSGIKEAPMLHTKTVNIGPRQLGRPQSRSIINCPPEVLNIEDAITTALYYHTEYDNLYGDGTAGAQICADLKMIDLTTLKKEGY